MAATTVSGDDGAARLYLFRHGTSEWNLLTKWQGGTDIPLAAVGIAQAEAAAAAVGETFSSARCSDLLRAARTADILYAANGGGEGCTVTRDPRLRECRPVPQARAPPAARVPLPGSYETVPVLTGRQAAYVATAHALHAGACSLGVFEGMTRDEVKGEHSQYLHIFERLAGLPHQERLDTAYFEELETPRQLATRAMESIQEVAKEVLLVAAGQAAAGGGRAACGLVVTHSTVLEAVLATYFGKNYDSVHTKTLAMVVLRCRGTEGGVVAFEIEHMQGVECEQAAL